MRDEQHGAGDDERILIFLANPLPVVGVGEDVFVGLQIFSFLIAPALSTARAPRLVQAAWPSGPRPAATSISGSTSASMTRRPDFMRSWLRNRRTVSRLPSTSSVPPEMNPAMKTRWKGRDVELGRDRGLDRNLVETGATGDASREDAAKEFETDSSGHGFP
jgi:hypothetical protein